MSATLDLLHRQIDYRSAVNHESDVLEKASYVQKTREVYAYLWEHINDIQALTAHHLGVTRASCVVSHWEEWMRGGFNVCIPVVVQGKHGQPTQKLLLRCPMKFKLGNGAGNPDEKIACETATDMRVREYHSSAIKTPYLFGFGFADGRTYTHAAYRPLLVRIARYLRRFLCAVFRFNVPTLYVRHQASYSLKTGYLLQQYITPSDGVLLSTLMRDEEGNFVAGTPTQRENLFRSLARITLSLARIPLPRIGSFTFCDDGTITLSNRPLTSTLAIMESRGVPRVMEQSSTYESVEPYIFDLLSYHDHRFLNQPNAVFHEEDGRKQMAEMVMLRAVGHHFISRDLRNGPFTLRLTDLHDGNIFVDKFWNITYIVDLEWACSLPIDMVDAPYWLTGLGVDEIQGDEYRAYDAIRQEYMRILKEEEARQGLSYSFGLAEHIEAGWRNGRYWYYLCLRSVNAMYTVFPHICAKYPLSGLSGDAAGILALLWDQHSEMTLDQKLKDKQKYDAELREAFNEPGQQKRSGISEDRDHSGSVNEARPQTDRVEE